MLLTDAGLEEIDGVERPVSDRFIRLTAIVVGRITPPFDRERSTPKRAVARFAVAPLKEPTCDGFLDYRARPLQWLVLQQARRGSTQPYRDPER